MLPKRVLTLAVTILAALVWAAGVVVVPMMAQAPSPTPLAPSPSPTQTGQLGIVRQYERVELVASLENDYANPYDPKQIAVWGRFQPPGDGDPISVPGFYTRPYVQTCPADCPFEQLEPVGDPGWRVRFAPPLPGRWTYTIEAQDAQGVRVINSGAFVVRRSDDPGPVRVGPNQNYFTFADGAPFFPIGQNLAWSWDEAGGIFAFERWLDALAASGANYARVYLDTPFFVGLDWPGPAGDYNDAQAAAWRMDRVLEMAEARGIYLHLVLTWSQPFSDYSPPEDAPSAGSNPAQAITWDDNPFNAANGGPLDRPAALFFDARARDLFQQRLFYVVARWGYSPHVFAWELFDQVDQVSEYTPARAVPWLTDHISYLRQMDGGRHLITAGTREPDAAIWRIPALDFVSVQYHPALPLAPDSEQAQAEAGAAPVDPIAALIQRLAQAQAYAHKPVVVTEFALDADTPAEVDPQGVYLHNNLWASVMAGSAGGGSSWNWTDYVESGDLYGLYTPLGQYARGIPWATANLEPVQVSLLADTPLAYSPLRLDAFAGAFQQGSPPNTTYRLTADGALPPESLLSGYLYGSFNLERSLPQTFILNPPVDTELRIGVKSVSATAPAALVIALDGHEAARVDFSPESRDIVVNLPLSAGSHTLVLDNLGQDWIELDFIEVADYRAPLRGLALADRQQGLLLAWVQHRDYNWQQLAEGVIPDALIFDLVVGQMPPGVYRVTYWDTLTGTVLGEETVTLNARSDGNLRLNLLPVTAQLAVRAVRIAGPEMAADTPTPQVITRTPQVSLTPTPSATLSPTATLTDTPSPTATETVTPSVTPSQTPSPTMTDTPTQTETPTPTETRTPTLTLTPSPSPTETVTPSRTPRPTRTNTPTPSDTPEPSQTPSRTPRPTRTNTPQPTDTRTPTLTETPLPSETPTNTPGPVQQPNDDPNDDPESSD